MQPCDGARADANDWEDLTKAKAVLLIGSNITETNPLTAVRIKEAIRVYKAQVVTLIRPSPTWQTGFSSLRHQAGHRRIVVEGLIKADIDQDLVDEP